MFIVHVVGALSYRKLVNISNQHNGLKNPDCQEAD